MLLCITVLSRSPMPSLLHPDPVPMYADGSSPRSGAGTFLRRGDSDASSGLLPAAGGGSVSLGGGGHGFEPPSLTGGLAAAVPRRVMRLSSSKGRRNPLSFLAVSESCPLTLATGTSAHV